MSFLSIASASCAPVSLSHGVVTITASALCSRRSDTHCEIFSSAALCVWLSIIAPACSIWSLKNSPKFFIYNLHLFTSATVVKLESTASFASIFSTARITSLSFPTPEGSIKILSGLNFSSTSLSALPKSPTSEQQIQPEFISVTSMPASCIKPPSIPISPNSFSMRTIFSPLYASLMSFFISVVLPAPRKPEKISIFVIQITLCNYIFY